MLTCPVAPRARLTLPGARPAGLLAPHRLARAIPASCCHACLRLAPDLLLPTSSACPADLLLPALACHARMLTCPVAPCARLTLPGARPAGLVAPLAWLGLSRRHAAMLAYALRLTW